MSFKDPLLSQKVEDNNNHHLHPVALVHNHVTNDPNARVLGTFVIIGNFKY